MERTPSRRHGKRHSVSSSTPSRRCRRSTDRPSCGRAIHHRATPMTDSARSLDTATLGGGCFWCLDAVYRGIKGVTKVESGYAGGSLPGPSYEQVCSGRTGHAEVVRLTFDPSVISFRELLDIFFVIHDPTTLNRQGADVGTQYRSVIFWHDDTQHRVAEEAIRELEASDRHDARIVTELAPAPEFFVAE